MRGWVLTLGAITLTACAHPQVVKIAWADPVSPAPVPVAGSLEAAGVVADAMVKRYGFTGEYILSRGGDSWAVDTITRSGPPKIATAARLWRWASVTKQVLAVLLMQEVSAGRVDLDASVATYLPRFASPNARLVTVRQLLRHQSGLPNPDDTAATPDAVPAYDAPGYRGSRDALTGYCAGPVKGPPGGAWSYNNCDYVVVGALLEAITGKPWQALVQDRIVGPLGLRSVNAFPSRQATVTGTVAGKPEPPIDFAAFGAAAALYGTASDLLRFDRALMAGGLLPEAQSAKMWDGQDKLGYIALGQWVFTVPVKGCAAPVRIVERR